jgi:hypothetical protein
MSRGRFEDDPLVIENKPQQNKIPAEQPKPDRVFKVSKRGVYVSENGMAYNAQGTSFINKEEESLYRQNSITEFTTSQAKAEQQRARLVGKPITLEEAIERVRTRDLGLNTNPVTGAVVARGDVRSERPLTKQEMDEIAVRRFPTLALQAKASGLTPQEQSEAVSLPLAIDAVKRIVNTRNPARQQQIVNTMGPDMQALMIDIVNAWQAEAQRNAAVSQEEDSENAISNAIGFVWDYTLGPAFDALFWATEKGVQAATAVTWMSSGVSAQEAWEMSQPGVLDQSMVDYARERYGDTTIDVILDAREAAESEDPNAAIAEIWDKYATSEDLEKLSILEQALSLSAYDQNTMDAITYLSTAETGGLGGLGNIFSWSFGSMLGIDPLSKEGAEAAQSPLFSTTRNTVNVISLFAFDPLIVGSKISGISKFFKYGLGKLGTGVADEAFQQPRVKRFFDTLGAGLTKADEAETPAQAAQIMNSLRSQYKNWLPAESLDALRWSGVRSGEDAALFFKDAQYIEILSKGQLAKRGDKVVIPHMVYGSSLAKRASLVARGLTYDRNAAKNIDNIFGAGVSDLIPEEAIPVIIKKLAEPSGDKFVGRMLSDFVFAKDGARRTFLGSIIGPSLKGVGDYSRAKKALARYGYKRKGDPRARLERVSRTMAHMPNVSDGLRIDNAADAAKIRDLMLYGGMPKYWADYSAELWKVMTPGQRKEFASGVGRSVGYSLGVDVVDPVNGARLIDNMVSGLRAGELYSPNYIDIPILKSTIAKQAEVESANTKIFNSFARDAKAAGVKLDDPRGADVIASSVYQYRAKKLVDSNPEVKYFPGPGGKIMLDMEDATTYQAYMKAFYPEIKDDTVVTLYRGLKEGEEAFVSPGTGQADIAAGRGSYWTTNPIVANGFGANTKIVSIDVRFGDLKNYQVNTTGKPKNTIVGPEDAAYGSEEAIILDYTKIPDSIKGSVKTVEIPVPEGSLNYYDGLNKLSQMPRIDDGIAVAAANNAPMLNPSLLDDGSSAALYDYQMTSIIGFPNMNALDQMSLRKSYLTALLGDNAFMSTVTDYWTLGTIGGPRFFLRNGLEDAGLYALTGGSWKGYRYGQLYSKATREATERIDLKDPSRVRGRKLGLGPTATRWLGDRLPKAFNGVILPHLDEAEIATAKILADKGDREALVSLIRKAFMRQKLVFIKKPKNEQVLKDLDEAAEHPAFYNMMDEASETTENLASGAMVGYGPNQTTKAILNGEIQDVAGIVLPYNTKLVVAEDPSSIRAWYNNINAVVYGDGPKVQTSAFLREYYQAKISGSADQVERVVTKYKDHLLENNRRMVDSSAIAQTEGPGSLARRKLDDALRVFTTKEGSFNDDLFNKIRREEVLKDGTVKTTYKMYDVVDGKQVMRFTEEDLTNMPGKPFSALGVDNMTVPISKEIPLSMRAWSAMGRSLARFTREPIFVANYLDARDFLRPIEKRLATEFGEEYATKWAVENGYERAYALTMAYTDNPNVRSQLAWNIRNVARFYRAQEDFFRRMMRTGRNNPMAIQRLNVAWHALDETGFVHEDEFGDKYLVWPGNKATLEGINSVTSLFGVNVLEGGQLTEFTSKITMFTPSADPNALAPTFAGVWGTTGFTGLMEIFPALKSFQDEVMGEYSVGRSWWEMVVPTNARKGMDLFNLAFKRDDFLDNDTVYADSARAAIQVYASTGLIDQSKQYSKTELAELKDNLNVAAVDITILRTLAGPTMPAAVSVNPQTVTDFAKSMGISGMRKVFIELVKANDNDFSLALSKWIKNNPGLSVFSVSENENPDSFGSFGATRETEKFIKENEELFKISKTGSAFFAPQEGVQNLGAWKYLASMGAKAPKTVEQYFNEMVTAEGYAKYRILQKQYYDGLDAGDTTVKSKWSNAQVALKSQYPMLDSRLRGDLSDGSSANPSDYRGDVEDIRTAVTWMSDNGKIDERGKDAQSVIKLYDEMSVKVKGLDQSDPMYEKNRKQLRDQWNRVESAWSPVYEGDVQWRLLMSATSGALGF